jgi:hypothetical protein
MCAKNVGGNGGNSGGVESIVEYKVGVDSTVVCRKALVLAYRDTLEVIVDIIESGLILKA